MVSFHLDTSVKIGLHNFPLNSATAYTLLFRSHVSVRNLISAVIERCSFKPNGWLQCPVFTSLVFYVIDSSIHGHFGKQLLSPGFLFKASYAFKVVLWKYTPYATWNVALMSQWSLYSLLKSFLFRRRIYRLYHSDRGRRSETPLLPYWLWLISTAPLNVHLITDPVGTWYLWQLDFSQTFQFLLGRLKHADLFHFLPMSFEQLLHKDIDHCVTSFKDRILSGEMCMSRFSLKQKD